jgi:hypoxanthine phosphoribosyltransferase
LHSIGEKKEDALVAAMEGGWKAVFFLSDFMNLRQIHSTATTKG